jgi:hypothetical protein
MQHRHHRTATAAVVFWAKAGAASTTAAAALTAVLEKAWKREVDTRNLLKLKPVVGLVAAGRAWPDGPYAQQNTRQHSCRPRVDPMLCRTDGTSVTPELIRRL